MLSATVGLAALAGPTLSLAVQQGGYKVGDRVEVYTAGSWNPAVIIEPRQGEYDGDYWVRFDWGTSAPFRAQSIRPIQPTVQPPPANPNTAGVNRPAAQAGPGPAPAQGANPMASRYGTRGPRTCADTKAPASGAITAALATRYFICASEGISSGDLYLVENVKLEVGAGVPYTPNLGSFEAINVRVPLYPIRGSFTRYQCRDLVREYVGPAGQSCNVYNNVNATGYCYKTTFNDWKCMMADRANTNVISTRNAGPKGP